MRNMRRFAVFSALLVLMMVGFGASPGMAHRARTYIFCAGL